MLNKLKSLLGSDKTKTLDEQANSMLGVALHAHGIDSTLVDGWHMPNAALPAIRCLWFQEEGKETGVLQVEVLVGDEGASFIEECFAGFGKDIEGIKSGFENFLANSFHVLIEAFWNAQYPDQITIENWKLGDSEYKAYIGNFGCRTFDDQSNHPEIPQDAFDVIEKSIKSSPIEQDVAWIRTFFCNIDSENQVYEALLNNEVWQEGEKALKTINWPKSDNYYSTRNFLVLKKVS